MFTQLSATLAFIPISIIVFLITMSKPLNTIGNMDVRCTNWKVYVFFFFYALALILQFNGYDFYSYSYMFYSKGGKYTGFEPLQYWIADTLNWNYLLWRIVIWGGSVFLLYKIAKYIELSNYRTLLVSLSLFGFGMCTVTRGFIGHTLLLFSALIIVSNSTNLFQKIFATILFLSTYFLHTSMFVNIIFAVLAFSPLDRKYFIFYSLLAFPFLTTAVTILIDGLLSGTLDISFFNLSKEYDITSKAVSYASRESNSRNIVGVLVDILHYLPEYLVMFYLVRRVIYDDCLSGVEKEKLFRYLLKLSYVAMYIASLFAFVETSSWIYARFKYMAFIPLPFLLAKIWSLEKEYNVWLRWIIIIQILSIFYTQFYFLYKYDGIRIA